MRAILSLFVLAAVTAQGATTFTYSLAKAGTTSAGVYSTNGVLLRTLWFNEPKPRARLHQRSEFDSKRSRMPP